MPSFFRTQGGDWQGELRMHLIDDEGNKDELLLYFIENVQTGKCLGDAKKFFGTAYGSPELASQAFDFDLMIDCRAPIGTEIQTFNLAVKSGKAGTYRLKASTIAQFALGTEIYIEDHQENVLIDLNQVSEYHFEMTEGGEVMKDRFQVHFRVNIVTSLVEDLAEQGIFYLPMINR